MRTNIVSTLLGIIVLSGISLLSARQAEACTRSFHIFYREIGSVMAPHPGATKSSRLSFATIGIDGHQIRNCSAVSADGWNREIGRLLSGRTRRTPGRVISALSASCADMRCGLALPHSASQRPPSQSKRSGTETQSQGRIC